MADGTQKVRVIVVHGIGSQRVGATAKRWADNLQGFATAAGYRVQVESAQLSTDPATVQLTVSPPIDCPHDTAPPTSCIEVVEARWADAFPEPNLGKVLRFLLQVVPTLAIMQTILLFGHHRGQGRKLTRAVRTATPLTPIALGIVALAFAAPLIATLLLVLLVAASIPVPAVRRAVGQVLGWLAASVGDAYLFVADPVSQSAMLKRLADCLATPDTARRPAADVATVVLAHSQGAAIAYRALQRMRPVDRPNALITLGSGLGRLSDVSRHCQPPWYLTLIYLAVIVQAVAAVAAHGTARVALGAGSAAYVLLAWWCCLRLVAKARRKHGAEAVDEAIVPIEGVTWLDIWAPFDPVPNGHAVCPDTNGAGYEHHLVAGELSLFRDHVRYERDWGQTMPLVLARILDPRGRERIVPKGTTAPGVRPGPGATGWLAARVGPFSRRDLVGLALRAVPLAAAAAAVCTADLYSLGLWLRTAAPGPVVGGLEALLYPLTLATHGLEPLGVSTPAREQALGVAALVGLGVLGSVAVRRTLSFLQDREVRAWLDSKRPVAAMDAKTPPRTEIRWSARRWALGMAVVALTSSLVPVMLMHPPAALRWTPRQAVQAYLTAMADDDVRRLCPVVTPGVAGRMTGDGVCSTTEAAPRRLCSAARGALAGLSEDAVQLDEGRTARERTVTLRWGPDGPPACVSTWSRRLLVPTAVSRAGDGWRVSAVGSPHGAVADEPPALASGGTGD